MQDKIDIAIVGAGPYGLSLGAHLAAGNSDVRVYGPPMEIWQAAMPAGMKLKSEGFASNLSDPAGRFTLQRYCADHHLPYQDVGLPVPIETFIDYGLEFQRRFVSQLDEHKIVAIEGTGHGFELRLDNGDEAIARKVVIATGISHFEYVPPGLRHLPTSLLTHSSAHSDVRRCAGGAAGKEIVVIGAGASAIDIAALLDECGAKVTIVARGSNILWCGPATKRSLLDKIRKPLTGLGTGWRNVMCVKAPLIFHAMPEAFRLFVVSNHLPPSPGWVPCERVQGHVLVKAGTMISAARVVGNRVVVTLRSDEQTYDLAADHVIAATGYKPDLRRLNFIGRSIRSRIHSINYTPALNRQFESSVPGLYFTGLLAANSFGPMLRFAYGADYVARRLTQELRRVIARTQVHHITQTQELTPTVP
jgi:thioredoxin reductase